MAWEDIAFFVEDGRLVMYRTIDNGHRAGPMDRYEVTPGHVFKHYPAHWEKVREMCERAGIPHDES